MDSLFRSFPLTPQHPNSHLNTRHQWLQINPAKCHFAQSQVEFLAHMSVPLSQSLHPLKSLQKFMGMLNFYCHFLPGIAKILKPFNDATSGTGTLSWTPAIQLPSTLPNLSSNPSLYTIHIHLSHQPHHLTQLPAHQQPPFHLQHSPIFSLCHFLTLTLPKLNSHAHRSQSYRTCPLCTPLPFLSPHSSFFFNFSKKIFYHIHSLGHHGIRPTHHLFFFTFCLVSHGHRHYTLDMPMHSLPKSQNLHSHLPSASFNSHLKILFFPYSCGPGRTTSTLKGFTQIFTTVNRTRQAEAMPLTKMLPQTVQKHFVLHGSPDLAFLTPSHLTVPFSSFPSSGPFCTFSTSLPQHSTLYSMRWWNAFTPFPTSLPQQSTHNPMGCWNAFTNISKTPSVHAVPHMFSFPTSLGVSWLCFPLHMSCPIPLQQRLFSAPNWFCQENFQLPQRTPLPHILGNLYASPSLVPKFLFHPPLLLSDILLSLSLSLSPSVKTSFKRW
jgi:hypothetical protein